MEHQLKEERVEKESREQEYLSKIKSLEEKLLEWKNNQTTINKNLPSSIDNNNNLFEQLEIERMEKEKALELLSETIKSSTLRLSELERQNLLLKNISNNNTPPNSLTTSLNNNSATVKNELRNLEILNEQLQERLTEAENKRFACLSSLDVEKETNARLQNELNLKEATLSEVRKQQNINNEQVKIIVHFQLLILPYLYGKSPQF